MHDLNFTDNRKYFYSDSKTDWTASKLKTVSAQKNERVHVIGLLLTLRVSMMMRRVIIMT